MNENYKYINDVLEKPLDSSQFASCCRKNNTIIAAGAGSGKTQVLASRFAWLVMSCNIKVEQILALTFTKKAASEIYQRIYQILRTFSNSAFTPAEEKGRAKIALKDFNKARIQTLDSYCSTIVKQAANKYGVRPDFKIGNLETLKNDALSFVIENKENFALLQFSKPGKLQNLANEFFVPIIENFCDVTCEENFFEKKLKKQKEEIVATWNFLIKRPFNLSESEKNRFQDILNKQIPDLAFIFESINSEISENQNNAELLSFSSIFYEFPEIEQLLIEDFENSRFQIEKIKSIFENSKEIASTRKKVFAIKY